MPIMSNKIIYILISTLFCLISCTPKELNEKELYAYLQDEDNGLFQKVNKDPFSVSVMYKPSTLMAKLEIEEGMSKIEIEEIKTRYEKNLYFVLSFSYKGQDLFNAFSNDKQKFSELNNNLSFGMKKITFLKSDLNTKLTLVDFFYTKKYGLGTGSKILLAFNKEKLLNQTKSKFYMTVKDIGIGIGKTVFSFETSDILNCPNIKSLNHEKNILFNKFYYYINLYSGKP